MTTETNLAPSASAEAEGGAAVRVHPLVMPLQCPFCGCSNAGGMVGWDKTMRMSGEQRYYFRCFGCGTLGPDAHTQPEALEAWNRRHNH